MILALVDDLMVGVRIEEAAKRMGQSAETISSLEEARRRLGANGVNGLVVDLALPGLDFDGLVRGTRAAGAWLVAFYPHVDSELRREAEAAGIEYLYPRSRFLRDLPKLLLQRLEKKS